MYNLERITIIISDIEKYIEKLKKYSITELSALSDDKIFHASSMIVFTILNRTIDLGNEILVSENVGAPQSNIDTMFLLAKAGIMNEKEAGELNKLIEKRNDFAHFYGSINEKKLFDLIKNIDVAKKFIEKLKKRILKKIK